MRQSRDGGSCNRLLDNQFEPPFSLLSVGRPVLHTPDIADGVPSDSHPDQLSSIPLMGIIATSFGIESL
jgi:hypothetical protein